MKQKLVIYLSFFVVLMLAYYAFVFTQTDISQSNLPVINNNIHPFKFVNQNGKDITERDMEGKVYVAEYFFTTCRGICPKMNANMRRVYDAFKQEPNFMILSHTCMPETDSVPLLKKYEQKMLLGKLVKGKGNAYLVEADSSVYQTAIPNNNTWQFVTGKKEELYGMARHSYIIDNTKIDTTSKVEDQFIHTQMFSLVDKQFRVRGIYDGLKEEEIQKLMRDIQGLLKENTPNQSLKQKF